MDKCTFDKGEKCSALNEKRCLSCCFRKTEEELEAGREKARERIESLPLVARVHIKNKYHL